MRRASWSWTALPVALALAGCAPRTEPGAAWRETITQVSTYDALAAGHYEGFIACSNLYEHGDTGLGTFDGLDGEMVVLDGHVYQVHVDGTVREAAPTDTVAFADVTWFEPDLMFDAGDMDEQVFKNTMIWKRPDPARAYAIRVTGLFPTIDVRSVPRQEKPYPPLSEIVPARQEVRHLENVEGTMVGFLLPDDVGTLMLAGIHLHFLTKDRTAGGHVLNFRLGTGRIELDEASALHVLLPSTAAPR